MTRQDTVIELPEVDYVREVHDEFRSVKLEPVSSSARPLPGHASPILISVIKNEGDRLADLLRHYREAGIARFCFIDNGSTDGSLAYLARQPDVDVWARTGKFDWKLKQGWINKAIELYGYDRWYLYVDADEHIVFDGIETRTFSDLAVEMDRRGVRRVRGFLLDMYREGPLLGSSYTAGDRLIDAYPFYDKSGYDENKYKQIMSVKGGPRKRVFSSESQKFNPEMTKYPLFRLRPGELMANPHHIWPFDDNFVSPRHLAVLHFKFLPSVAAKIELALREGNYWDGSIEYKCYRDALKKTPDLSMHGPQSSRFGGARQLVEEELIAPVSWTAADGVVGQMLAAARRHRAALDAGDRFVPTPVVETPATPKQKPAAAAPAQKTEAPAPKPVSSSAKPVAPAAKPAAPPGAKAEKSPVQTTPAPKSGSPAPAAPKGPGVTVSAWNGEAPGNFQMEVMVTGLKTGDAGAGQARFKFQVINNAPRLEFRKRSGWPLFASNWPGTREDHLGPVFHIRAGAKKAALAEAIKDEADRATVEALLRGLDEIVASAATKIGLPAKQRDLVTACAGALKVE